MNIVQSSKERWLLFGGIILLLLGLLMLGLLGVEDYQGSRTYEGISLQMFIVTVVVIAPIIEELAFRGSFTRSKILRWAAIIVLPLFMIRLETEWIGWLLLLVFYLLHFLSLRIADSALLRRSALLINALLFGFIHYKISDFTMLNTAYFVLFQIALGLILLWVTLNFGILKSMLVHCLYNSALVAVTVLYVQFPDQTPQHFENNVIKVEWRRVPALDNNNFIYSPTKRRVVVNNIDGQMFYNLSGADAASTAKIRELEPWTHFDFAFILKDTTGNAVLRDEVKKYLETEMIRALEQK